MPISVYIFILIQMAVVGYWDLKTKKISNYWSILNLIVFIIILCIFSDIYILKMAHLKYPFIILIVGIVLFFKNIMGAGDVKYLSSSFLLVPEFYHEKLVWYLLFFTIIFAGVLALKNTFINLGSILTHLKNREFLMIKTFYGTKFSYSPVILFSWIYWGWEINVFMF
ncbi:MAG: prepilin peptidase [Oligoflexia bacterium]|nr:prepilin peptidase [Oligoflexia bacterium]